MIDDFNEQDEVVVGEALRVRDRIPLANLKQMQFEVTQGGQKRYFCWCASAFSASSKESGTRNNADMAFKSFPDSAWIDSDSLYPLAWENRSGSELVPR